MTINATHIDRITQAIDALESKRVMQTGHTGGFLGLIPELRLQGLSLDDDGFPEFRLVDERRATGILALAYFFGVRCHDVETWIGDSHVKNTDGVAERMRAYLATNYAGLF